jgi:hypothetical protein
MLTTKFTPFYFNDRITRHLIYTRKVTICIQIFPTRRKRGGSRKLVWHDRRIFPAASVLNAALLAFETGEFLLAQRSLRLLKNGLPISLLLLLARRYGVVAHAALQSTPYHMGINTPKVGNNAPNSGVIYCLPGTKATWRNN